MGTAVFCVKNTEAKVSPVPPGLSTWDEIETIALAGIAIVSPMDRR